MLPTIPGRPAACLRAARGPALLAALALAGCLAGPVPSGGAADDPTPSNTPSTEAYEIPKCIRVWNEARGDSAWRCPDPKPPAPMGGSPG